MENEKDNELTPEEEQVLKGLQAKLDELQIMVNTLQTTVDAQQATIGEKDKEVGHLKEELTNTKKINLSLASQITTPKMSFDDALAGLMGLKRKEKH